MAQKQRSGDYDNAGSAKPGTWTPPGQASRGKPAPFMKALQDRPPLKSAQDRETRDASREPGAMPVNTPKRGSNPLREAIERKLKGK